MPIALSLAGVPAIRFSRTASVPTAGLSCLDFLSKIRRDSVDATWRPHTLSPSWPRLALKMTHPPHGHPRRRAGASGVWHSRRRTWPLAPWMWTSAVQPISSIGRGSSVVLCCAQACSTLSWPPSAESSARPLAYLARRAGTKGSGRAYRCAREYRGSRPRSISFTLDIKVRGVYLLCRYCVGGVRYGDSGAEMGE